MPLLGGALKITGLALKSAVNRARAKRAEKRKIKAQQKFSSAESALLSKVQGSSQQSESNSAVGSILDLAANKGNMGGDNKWLIVVALFVLGVVSFLVFKKR